MAQHRRPTSRGGDRPAISVVTPTLGRPGEVRELLENLARQTVTPLEVILVDAGPEAGDDRTGAVVEEVAPALPFTALHLAHGGGTAIQRNVGIDHARGSFIALVDDDIRLEPDFLERMLEAFAQDPESNVGGIAGYITNQHLDPTTSRRWRWYRRLRLFTVWEPGRYDYATGYPINRYLQPPHDGLREIEHMGAGCAVWRRQVFAGGLRFAHFFTGYGVLEDAHLALRAGRRWRLLENGRARCLHLRSPVGRLSGRQLGLLSALNYRFVFVDLVRRRTWSQELRFFTVQAVDLLRFAAAFLRRPDRDRLGMVAGKIEGMARALWIRPGEEEP